MGITPQIIAQKEKEQEKTKLVLTLSRKFTLKLLDSTCSVYKPFFTRVSRMRIHSNIADMKKMINPIKIFSFFGFSGRLSDKLLPS